MLRFLPVVDKPSTSALSCFFDTLLSFQTKWKPQPRTVPFCLSISSWSSSLFACCFFAITCPRGLFLYCFSRKSWEKVIAASGAFQSSDSDGSDDLSVGGQKGYLLSRKSIGSFEKLRKNYSMSGFIVDYFIFSRVFNFYGSFTACMHMFRLHFIEAMWHLMSEGVLGYLKTYSMLSNVWSVLTHKVKLYRCQFDLKHFDFLNLVPDIWAKFWCSPYN